MQIPLKVSSNRIILRLDSVNSTNQFAADWIQNDLPPDGSVALSQNQNEGRGQMGTEWVSEPGKNLTLSYIYSPGFLLVSEQFILSKLVALAVCETVEHFTQKTDQVAIKWPNDIYLNHLKIAGILIENTLNGAKIKTSIFGIGLNVNQENFDSKYKATSLKNSQNKDFDLNEVFDYLSIQIDHYYYLLQSGKVDLIDEKYHSHLYLKGIKSRFDYLGNEIIATVKGVIKTGKLELVTEGGKTIFADLKELIFRHEP